MCLKCNKSPGIPILSDGYIQLIEHLLQHKQIYGDKTQLNSIIKWSSLICLLKRTKDEQIRTDIKKGIKKSSPDIGKAVSYALTHVIPSQLRAYGALTSGLQSFEEITATNLIKGDIEINGKKLRAKVPRIVAPSSFIKVIAKHFQITHLDAEIDEHGFQSVTQLIGELNGYYSYYRRERYQILKEKSNEKPIFHGQELEHAKIETTPDLAINFLNNQLAPYLIHPGSLGAEKAYAYLHMQSFNRGKKGLKRTYMQALKAKVGHNLRRFEFWKERQFERLEWSSLIINDFTKLYNKFYKLKDVKRAIKQNGYYKIDCSNDPMMEYVKSKVSEHKMVKTSKAIWKSH